MERSIQIVEEENLEQELRNAVIELWNEIEEGFRGKEKTESVLVNERIGEEEYR